METGEYFGWLLLSAQTMACAAGSTAPHLPRWILAVYSIVSFFNFDTSWVLHEECDDGGYPFTLSRLILASGLCALVVLATLMAVQSMRASRAWRHEAAEMLRTVSSTRRGRVTFHQDRAGEQYHKKLFDSKLRGVISNICLGVILAHAIVFKDSIRFLHCVPSPSGRVMANGPSTVKTFISANNETNSQAQSLKCWEGDHTSIGLLSVFALCLFCMGFPAGVWLCFQE